MDNSIQFKNVNEIDEFENQLDVIIKEFERDENEEDERIIHSLEEIDRLFDSCDQKDEKLRNLLMEKRELLQKIRFEKSEFMDTLYQNVKNEKYKLDEKRRELKKSEETE